LPRFASICDFAPVFCQNVLKNEARKMGQNGANRALSGRKTSMIRILFICHGNICRSPMAEFVMKDLVKKAGLEDEFEIASAATSTEEIWGGRGNPVYPPARKKLKEHGIDPGGKRARRTTREDYKYYDYLIGMDYANVYNMKRIYGGDPDGKISLLLDHCGRTGQEVADPWYTDNFDATWDDVLQGCTALLKSLAKQR
jgi:protein-tyrosine phosphatase